GPPNISPPPFPPGGFPLEDWTEDLPEACAKPRGRHRPPPRYEDHCSARATSRDGEGTDKTHCRRQLSFEGRSTRESTRSVQVLESRELDRPVACALRAHRGTLHCGSGFCIDNCRAQLLPSASPPAFRAGKLA